MNYTAKQFHLHYIAQYTLIVKANYQYDLLYVLDQEAQLLVYMKFESQHPTEEALKLLSLPFQQVYISIPTHNLTFIPDELYQDVDSEKYKVFMENPALDMMRTSLDFLNIQALYQYDILLFHRWNTLFPEAKFIPEFKLNLIQARPFIPLKGEVIGLVFDQHNVDIYLFINGQFKFFNNFEVINEDDLSYFILNVFENFHIEGKVNKALISGVDIDESFIKKMKNFAQETIQLTAHNPAKALDDLSDKVINNYLLDLPTCE